MLPGLYRSVAHSEPWSTFGPVWSLQNSPWNPWAEGPTGTNFQGCATHASWHLLLFILLPPYLCTSCREEILFPLWPRPGGPAWLGLICTSGNAGETCLKCIYLCVHSEPWGLWTCLASLCGCAFEICGVGPARLSSFRACLEAQCDPCRGQWSRHAGGGSWVATADISWLNAGLESNRPWTRGCCLPAVGPGTGQFTFLSLSFLISKMGAINTLLVALMYLHSQLTPSVDFSEGLLCARFFTGPHECSRHINLYTRHQLEQKKCFPWVRAWEKQGRLLKVWIGALMWWVSRWDRKLGTFMPFQYMTAHVSHNSLRIWLLLRGH